MNQRERDNIDRLVGIWVTGMLSTAQDAGWEGVSLAARLIEYEGQPPAASGNDQSNLAMINAIRLLRKEHAEYPVISAVMRVLLRMRDTRDIALAITAKHYYQGLRQQTNRAWTHDDRAAELDMTPRQFKWCLQRAYHVVQHEIDRLNLYSRLVG